MRNKEQITALHRLAQKRSRDTIDSKTDNATRIVREGKKLYQITTIDGQKLYNEVRTDATSSSEGSIREGDTILNISGGGSGSSISSHLDLSDVQPDTHHFELHLVTSHTDVSALTGTGTTLVLDTSPIIVTPTIASMTNAQHNHADAAGGGVIALGTATSGHYVATITGGTGLTSTAATSGEGTTHSLSVDASQTQVTSVGVLNVGSITSGFGTINTGSSTITTSGTVSTGALTIGGDIDFNSSTINLATQATAFELKQQVNALAFNGAANNILNIDATNNRVGIGTAAPQADGLSVTGASGYDETGILQITTGTGANTDSKLVFGVVDTDYAYIQSVKPGDNQYDLALNPVGGNVGIGTAAPAGDLAVSRSTGGQLWLTRDDSEIVINDILGEILFAGSENSGTAWHQGAGILARTDEAWDNASPPTHFGTRLEFITCEAATSSQTTKMTILGSGNVGIGDTGPNTILHLSEVHNSGAGATLTLSNPSTAGATTPYVAISAIQRSEYASGEIRFGKETTYAATATANSYMSFYTAKANSNVLAMYIDQDQQVGIGTPSPLSELDVSNASECILNVISHVASADGSRLDLRHSRNTTIGSHAAINAADIIGQVNFIGSDGNSWEFGAKIECRAEETWDNDSAGAYLSFHTVDSGVTSQTVDERMRIDHNGNVGIGTTSPDSQFVVAHASAPVIELSLGTDSSEVAIADGGTLGTINFSGHDSGAYEGVQTGAAIRGEAAGDWDENNVNDAPAELQFFTQSDGTGTGLGTPRMTIKSDGNIIMNSTTDGGVLFGGASNAITDSGVMANGELLIGDNNGSPVNSTLTKDDGINITNAAGTITIKGVAHTASNSKLLLTSSGFGVDESLEPTWTETHHFKNEIIVTGDNNTQTGWSAAIGGYSSINNYPITVQIQDDVNKMYTYCKNDMESCYSGVGISREIDGDDDYHDW